VKAETSSGVIVNERICFWQRWRARGNRRRRAPVEPFDRDAIEEAAMKDYLRQLTTTAAICVLAIAAYTTIKGEDSTASARTVTPSATSSVLHVTGASTVHVRPDRALITFSVRGGGHSLAAAERTASRKMNRLLGAMTADGVMRRDLQTQDQNASAAGGGHYIAYQQLNVTVRHVLAVGKLVSDGVATGAARDSEGPVYSLTSEQSAYREALAAAIKQARARADAIAGAAGLHVTGVVSIQQVRQPQPVPYPGVVYGAAADTAVDRMIALPARPGRRDVSASLTVVYAYAPA
jgi:uncharacterized protein YggE